MSTLSAFREAGINAPELPQAWIARLERLSSQDIEAIFAAIPCDRMSAVAKDFAYQNAVFERPALLTL